MNDDDERRPPTVRPLRDPRRTTGRLNVPAIQPRPHDGQFERRIISELNMALEGIGAGLSEHVTNAVRAEIAVHVAQLSKLDEILTQLEEDRRDRIEWRREQKIRADAEKESRARELHMLALARGGAEVGHITASTHLQGVESSRKYRAALWTVIGTIVAALLTLAGMAIGSQRRGP